MTRDTLYTAIDLGTSKVCTTIARVGPEGELKILGMSITPSQGIQKGRIVNMAEAQEATQASITEAQRYLGKGIPWAYVNVTGSHISCLNTTSLLQSPTQESPVSLADVEQLIHSSYPEVTSNKEVLHVIPTTYVVDGNRGVRNPVGLHTDRLQVESHVVLGEKAILRNVIKTVEECKVSVRGLVLAPLASGEAILSKDEKEIGVLLLDIGAGTTDIAIFRNGSLWYNASIPVGGNQLTRDLAVDLGVPYYFAEELKVRWGHAMPNGAEAEEEVLLPSFQGRPRRLIRRNMLCKSLVDRLQETLGLVLLKIQQAGLERPPPAGVVITGGSAEMPGVAELAKRVLSCPARIAAPQGVPGLSQELETPALSTTVGLLFWGIKHHGEKRVYSNGEKSLWGHKALARRLKRSFTTREATT